MAFAFRAEVDRGPRRKRRAWRSQLTPLPPPPRAGARPAILAAAAAAARRLGGLRSHGRRGRGAGLAGLAALLLLRQVRALGVLHPLLDDRPSHLLCGHLCRSGKTEAPDPGRALPRPSSHSHPPGPHNLCCFFYWHGGLPPRQPDAAENLLLGPLGHLLH